MIACVVIANVEQYSYARQWYAKPPGDDSHALLAAPALPPPPLIMYSQAPAPPTLVAAAQPPSLHSASNNPTSPPATPPTAAAASPAAPGSGGEELHSSLALSREVPRLSCAMHPWVSSPLRRGAIASLGQALLGAWQRGVHDPVLVFVLEAALTVRRVSFGMQAFATEEEALQACLFCLSLMPLLGGGTLLMDEPVLDKLLPLCTPAHPASTTELALQALQNACSDTRLVTRKLPPQLEPALRRAACTLPSALADTAFGALANLEQLRISESLSSAAEGAVVGARTTPPMVGSPHLLAPPPLHRPEGGTAPATGGHRAIAKVCQQLQPWATAAAQRRGACALGDIIGSRTLDAEAAILLLFHCKAVPLLVRLLDGPAEVERNDETARVGSPPSQTDPQLRDECLYCLALIARLGGAPLLQPVGMFVNLLGGALLAPEPRTRLYAAFFWQCASAWEEFAEALAKSIFAVTAVRDAGLPHEGGGTYAAGLAVMRALADSGTHLSAKSDSPSRLTPIVAAGCLANVLQHEALEPLWTTAPARLGYLLQIDAAERSRLLGLPSRLQDAMGAAA